MSRPVADLFHEIASALFTARLVLRDGIGGDDQASLFAAVALIEQAGALADDAANAAGGVRVTNRVAWLCSPRASEALKHLAAPPAAGDA